jgi:hypothetical protein
MHLFTLAGSEGYTYSYSIDTLYHFLFILDQFCFYLIVKKNVANLHIPQTQNADEIYLRILIMRC